MLTAVSWRLILYLSPRKRLSSPTVMSKRCRGATRGGFLSSLAVPGAGMLTRVDPNSAAGHGDGKGVVGVARTLPQNIPAWNSWSGLSPLAARSTGPPSETGTAPATSPLSYRQLKPTHGPVFHGWYCM